GQAVAPVHADNPTATRRAEVEALERRRLAHAWLAPARPEDDERGPAAGFGSAEARPPRPLEWSELRPKTARAAMASPARSVQPRIRRRVFIGTRSGAGRDGHAGCDRRPQAELLEGVRSIDHISAHRHAKLPPARP